MDSCLIGDRAGGDARVVRNHEWPKVVNSSFARSTDRNLSGLFLQVHFCVWETWLLGKFSILCPQRMMNYWVEKLLGIDKEYGNSTILQIMIRINTMKPRRRRRLEAC